MKKTLSILLLLGAYQAHSQRIVTPQYLYWIRYQNQLALSPKYYWVNEIENRRFFNPDVENQLIAHSHFHYKPGKWDLAGGLTLSWIYAQKPEDGFQHAVFEIRPFLEASNELQIGKIYFQNRLRVDNRFFQANRQQTILEDTYYVMRLRYRVQARIVLKRKEDIPTIGLRVGDEIMLNTKQKTFDQNRIYISMDFAVLKNLSLEPSYVYVYQQRIVKDEFLSRQVIRFSLIHRI